MKILFTMVLVVACIAAFLSNAVAETACPYKSQMEMAKQMLIAHLEITPAQQAEFDKVGSQFISNSKQVYNSNASNQEKFPKLQAGLNQSILSAMSILTPQQTDKLLSTMNSWIKMSPDFTVSKLDISSNLVRMGLTQSKSQSIVEILSAHSGKAMSIRTDENLTADVKVAKLDENRVNTLSAIKSTLNDDEKSGMDMTVKMMESANNTIKSNLTNTQQTKYDEIVKSVLTFIDMKVKIK